jgi:heme-degrading monooxygenase HmoA
MIAILFELWPAEGRAEDYFGLAASLKSDLKRIDGFISVERFQSLAEPGKLLSLSFFRDEEAVRAWRDLPGHRAAQARGRSGILADYRLRVAEVLRDYGKEVRDEAPPDSRQAHG